VEEPTAGRSDNRRIAIGVTVIAGIIGGAVLIGIAVSRPPDDGTASTSASAAASAPASSSPSASAAPSEIPSASPATPEPTVQPTPTAVPVPNDWTLAGTFGEDDQQPTFVFDVTTWQGGYVAVGTRYDDFVNDCCGPNAGQLLLWTSDDGTSWEERPLMITLPTFDDGPPDMRVEHILQLSDRQLMVVYDEASSSEPEVQAWVSDDAIVWTEVDLGLGSIDVDDEAQGPHGFILIGHTPAGAAQIWRSSNGLAWEIVHEDPPDAVVQLGSVDAGPDGFVVTGARRGGTDRPYILASSDGRTWFVADEDQASFLDGDFPIDVAALGSDWVATGFGAEESEQRPVVWRSTNGLDWTRDLGPTDPDGRDSYYATDIAGNGGIAVISPAEAGIGGPFQFPTWPWSTTDGVGWTQLPTDAGYVTEMATNGSTIVAVGNIGRGSQGAMWVVDDPD
jgi:hypothetical protein